MYHLEVRRFPIFDSCEAKFFFLKYVINARQKEKYKLRHYGSVIEYLKQNGSASKNTLDCNWGNFTE